MMQHRKSRVRFEGQENEDIEDMASEQEQFQQPEPVIQKEPPSDQIYSEVRSTKSKAQSRKSSRVRSSVKELKDHKNTRTKDEIEQQLHLKAMDLSREAGQEGCDDIRLMWNQDQVTQMNSAIDELFDFLKAKDQSKDGADFVDHTHLKAYFTHQNVQNLNPTLYKRVNDQAASKNFEGFYNKDQFRQLLMNDNLLKSNIDQPEQGPPSIEELCEIFEFLDEDRTGMISTKDLLGFLELTQRLKNARFNQDEFIKQKTDTSPALNQKLNKMRKEVDELIEYFDLTGDRLISPEEFFNMIMFAFGY